ncbi:NAD(P)-dependent oxidoreductase, partial [Desulfococcus sp.]|uniref:NAD(P)-dependent oxidoreductase n=1 Tax=Desulfococcus sp. TaxID=2025834 RepID=UPI0035937805
MNPMEAGKTRIGWIGTGVMGGWMCKHLMDRGFEAVVHSRTREKAAPMIARGASWADSPAAVARAADVIFTMVGTPEDVRSVYFGDAGVLAGASAGKVLVDMTTTRPRLAAEIFRAAGARGAGA